MGSPTIITAVKTVQFYTKQSNTDRSQHIAHQGEVKFLLPNFEIIIHHHVQEGLGLIPVPCILKMKLVPPSLPWSSYVSSSFWFIL